MNPSNQNPGLLDSSGPGIDLLKRLLVADADAAGGFGKSSPNEMLGLGLASITNTFTVFS